MTFLPIVERELRVNAHKRATYLSRSWVAGAMLILWTTILLLMPASSRPTERGQTLFWTFSVILVLAGLFYGIFLTSDCISEERREGTIGLLFLTDLRALDVVLGKLASTSLRSVFDLMAIYPVIALSLLLGGVTAGDLGRVILTTGATVFFSLSAGLMVSCFIRDSRGTISVCLFLMLAITGLPPALWAAIHSINPKQDPVALLLPSPFFSLYEAPSNAFKQTHPFFWESVGVIFALGVGFLSAACIILPLVWQTTAERGRDTEVKTRSRWRFGGIAAAAAIRGRLLDQNPCRWLASRDRLSKWLGLTIFGLAGIVWLALFKTAASDQDGFESDTTEILVYAALGLHVLFKILLSVEATRWLSNDSRSGALELLLVTPVNSDSIFRGQFKALWRNFRTPGAILAAMNLGLLGFLYSPPRQNNHTEVVVFTALFTGGILMLLTDGYAMAWSGMWAAVRGKKHVRAGLLTLGKVLGLAWLPVVIAIPATYGGSSDITAEVFTFCWIPFTIANDLFWAIQARRRLKKDFRLAAANNLPPRRLRIPGLNFDK